MSTEEQATAAVHAAVPALQRFGLEVVELGAGRLRLRMPFEGNGNHMGTMYAGALFAVAELPGGLLPMSVLQSDAVVPVLKELTIRFVRPAHGDVWVEAALDPETLQALARQAVETGRAEFVLDLHVIDDRNRVVAESSGTYQLRRR